MTTLDLNYHLKKMLSKISNFIKDYFLFLNSSIYELLVTIPALIVTIFFLVIIFLNNPFSSYSHHEDVDLYEKIPSHLFKQANLDTLARYFDLVDDSYIKIPKIEGNTIKIIRVDGNVSSNKGIRTENEIRMISKHPIKPLSKYKNSILLFGTTENAKDYLSILTENGKRTFVLILYTITSFILSGLFFGIIIGYYNQGKKYSFISFMQKTVKEFNNMIESTPLLLWILLSIIIIELAFSTLRENSIQNITFILFGFFSSPALSKILSNKIKELKAEEFVTALKLQGIKDRNIIFHHIIRYYCLPIIFFQICYMVAQTLFLDISLNILQFSFLNGLGSIIFPLFNNSNSIGNSTQLFIVVIMIFSFISTFYSLAKFIQIRYDK